MWQDIECPGHGLNRGYSWWWIKLLLQDKFIEDIQENILRIWFEYVNANSMLFTFPIPSISYFSKVLYTNRSLGLSPLSPLLPTQRICAFPLPQHCLKLLVPWLKNHKFYSRVDHAPHGSCILLLPMHNPTLNVVIYSSFMYSIWSWIKISKHTWKLRYSITCLATPRC